MTPSTLRSALEPARWHVVSDSLSGGDAADQQQAGVHFGGNSQREALLLDYDLPSISPQQLERAFLIVVPLPDAPQGPEPAAISAWRIIEAWDHPGPLHTPQATHPSARGIASAPLPLRIDVTLLVRRWLENPSSTHGLVLKSSSTQGHPQIFATGVGGGHSPVLELYHAAPAARATQ